MKAKKHGSFHQKHSLGQNFIEDETLLEQLADLSLVTSQDCVLEIGPHRVESSVVHYNRCSDQIDE